MAWHGMAWHISRDTPWHMNIFVGPFSFVVTLRFTFGSFFAFFSRYFPRVMAGVFLPEGVKYYPYMLWITLSSFAIWCVTICEKLVLKVRAPRGSDVSRPLKAIAKSFLSKVVPTFAPRANNNNGRGMRFRNRSSDNVGSGANANANANAKQDKGNDCPFVLVHGLAGWGAGTGYVCLFVCLFVCVYVLICIGIDVFVCFSIFPSSV